VNRFLPNRLSASSDGGCFLLEAAKKTLASRQPAWSRSGSEEFSIASCYLGIVSCAHGFPYWLLTTLGLAHPAKPMALAGTGAAAPSSILDGPCVTVLASIHRITHHCAPPFGRAFLFPGRLVVSLKRFFDCGKMRLAQVGKIDPVTDDSHIDKRHAVKVMVLDEA
jgi:hypothetical protein